MDADDGLSGWFIGSNDLAGVYTYACQDTKYGDFYYLFRYQAFWMRPAAMALLHAVSARVLHSSARARCIGIWRLGGDGMPLTSH